MAQAVGGGAEGLGAVLAFVVQLPCVDASVDVQGVLSCELFAAEFALEVFLRTYYLDYSNVFQIFANAGTNNKTTIRCLYLNIVYRYEEVIISSNDRKWSFFRSSNRPNISNNYNEFSVFIVTSDSARYLHRKC